MTVRLLVYLSAMMFACAIATAAAEQRSHRELGAHEHGHAVMNIAQDGNALEIELESPSVNIVGFEHQPENDAQRQKIKNSIRDLEQADELFLLSEASGCVLSTAEVEASQMGKHADAHEQTAHSAFYAHYAFTCSEPDALDHIETRLFEQFPGIEELEVNAVTERGQYHAELSADMAKFSF